MIQLNSIIKPVFAADIDVGGIEGVGPFGFANKALSSQNSNSVAGGQFSNILSTVITSLSVVGGLAFVIFFSLGGLKWLTAGGDKAKVQEAQQQMTQGVIGLVAIVASLFVVGIVGNVLGIDILNPFKTLFGGAAPVPVNESGIYHQ